MQIKKTSPVPDEYGFFLSLIIYIGVVCRCYCFVQVDALLFQLIYLISSLLIFITDERWVVITIILLMRLCFTGYVALVTEITFN